MIHVALAGNPNSGKTTLFNQLTGSSQYVGNWPGVTVEKKEGKYTKDKNIIITDLPGIYSLSPYTLEEVVSREYLLSGTVDVLINIVDGSNLERNLFLTTQLLELGIPTVVAINMLDVLEKRKQFLNLSKLSSMLHCPVVSISALKNRNLDDLMETVYSISKDSVSPLNIYEGSLNQYLMDLSKSFHFGNLNLFYAVKCFEEDEKIMESIGVSIDSSLLEKAHLDFEEDGESIITDARYAFIQSLCASLELKKIPERLRISDRIDRIVTNRILALPIFVLVMWAVYYISVTTVGTFMTDWTNDVLFAEIILPGVAGFLESLHVASWLQSLIVDGIVGGIGAVLGFIPQMMVLFLLLAILEDCGYMARIAFIMDRIFRKFGLSGKSFIPMLIGTGCGVPAIMASRTIENEQDRKMTIITTTFIPCSAKLPIIGLIAGALFHGASWVAPSAYFVGMAAIVLSGILLKKTKLFSGDTTPFVMEMPEYHLPQMKNVLRSVWQRSFSFIKKAGTVILLSTIVIWFLSNFGFENGSFGMVADINLSLLSGLGRMVAWIFVPLGWGEWKAAVSTIMGLVAKENVVGTFGQLYGFAKVAEEGNEIWTRLAMDFTAVSAYSFLVFNLLCAPCFAAIGAIKREMNDAKWTWFAIAYQTGFAYAVSLIIYQIGNFVLTKQFTIGTFVGFIVFGVILYMVVRPVRSCRCKTCTCTK